MEQYIDRIAARVGELRPMLETVAPAYNWVLTPDWNAIRFTAAEPRLRIDVWRAGTFGSIEIPIDQLLTDPIPLLTDRTITALRPMIV